MWPFKKKEIKESESDYHKCNGVTIKPMMQGDKPVQGLYICTECGEILSFTMLSMLFGGP